MGDKLVTDHNGRIRLKDDLRDRILISVFCPACLRMDFRVCNIAVEFKVLYSKC